jgi:hypothetical protein
LAIRGPPAISDLLCEAVRKSLTSLLSSFGRAIGFIRATGGLTMRMLALTAFAASVAVTASMIALVPATAQTEPPCGPVAYSVADQRYVGRPCTPKTPQVEAGKSAPCGMEAYSVADQRYVSTPCTAPTPQAEPGKAAPCGPVAYSVAEQRYVGVPCTH